MNRVFLRYSTVKVRGVSEMTLRQTASFTKEGQNYGEKNVFFENNIINYLLSYDEIDMHPTSSALLLYQGHHFDKNAAYSSIIFPTTM